MPMQAGSPTPRMFAESLACRKISQATSFFRAAEPVQRQPRRIDGCLGITWVESDSDEQAGM